MDPHAHHHMPDAGHTTMDHQGHNMGAVTADHSMHHDMSGHNMGHTMGHGMGAHSMMNMWVRSISIFFSNFSVALNMKNIIGGTNMSYMTLHFASF